MDIETQRESCIRLTGGHWVIFSSKVVKLIAPVLLILFATAFPAQAADTSVESVPLEKFWCAGGTNICTYLTDMAAAQAEAAYYNRIQNYAAYGYTNQVIVGCNGKGYCRWSGINLPLGATQLMLVDNRLSCPVPKVNPEVPYVINYENNMCERPDVCPIDDLSTDPKDPKGLKAFSKQFNETPEQAELTQNLEEGMNGYSLLSPETRNAEQCLAGRIASELLQENSRYKVTATVRTLAYQAHLRKVWDKFFELQNKIKKKPAIKQMCPALIAKVEGEMGFRIDQDPTDSNLECTAAGRNHCIVQQPAAADPKHVKNLAFDISRCTVRNFQNILLPPRTMATEANACKLTWGGTFRPKPDPVHFFCCVK